MSKYKDISNIPNPRCTRCGELLGDMDWTGCPHTCEYEEEEKK